MPAVTVENILTLPRVAQPREGAQSRPVRSVSTAPKGFEGEGFPVRRAFAGTDLAALRAVLATLRRADGPQSLREPLLSWAREQGHEV